MFRCNKCKKITKLGEKENKIVTETRDRIYTKKDKYGREHEMAKGLEIVTEISVCDSCNLEYKK